VSHLTLKQEQFINNLRVLVTLRDSSLRWTRYPLGATKIVVSHEMFVLPSPLWGFDSEELDLILVIVRGGLGLRETQSFVGTSMKM
jgi:hypothetical protein